MSETLAELAETDALLTAVSRGNLARTGDPILDALSGWVDEITSHPVRRIEVDLPEFYAREAGGRAWRIAAAAIVVTAMSSSGIAAAATGDPLAPFSYVATALGNLAPTARADDMRFGSPMSLGIDRGPTSQGADGTDSDGAYLSYEPTYGQVQGRHRAIEQEVKPRHRATATGVAGAVTATAYKPRHVATDVSATTSDPVGTASETPVSTPPASTPAPETPAQPTTPSTGSEATDPDPQPVGGGGVVVTQPPESAPADSAPTGSGATGGDATGSATDSVQVRVSEDAPADAPVDQALGE